MKYLGILLVLFMVGCGTSKNSIYQVDSPSELFQDQELNDAEKEKLRLGIIEHDQGNYERAVELYTSILSEKPHSALTLHEVTLTETAMGDFKKSIEFAKVGQQIQSDMLFSFYHMQGINLDYLKRPKQAMEAFKASIQINPNFDLAHYSLAITSLNTGNVTQGVESLENAIKVNFGHKSSHLLLGKTYHNQGKNVSALFAYTYFILYEPNSQRTQEAYGLIEALFNQAVQDEETGKVSVSLNFFDMMEGGFPMAELVFSGHIATRYREENLEDTEIEFIAKGYEVIFEYLVKQEEREAEGNQPFVKEYYAPYFQLVHENGYTKPMVYLLFENSMLEGVTTWLDENWELCEEFLNWEPYSEENVEMDENGHL